MLEHVNFGSASQYWVSAGKCNCGCCCCCVCSGDALVETSTTQSQGAASTNDEKKLVSPVRP